MIDDGEYIWFSCDKDKEVLSKTNYEINKLMKKDNTLIRLILFFLPI